MKDEKPIGQLPEYSVAMSVYSGENSGFFRQSLESMFLQTHPCKELILVCDGTLNVSLDSVIDDFSKAYREQLIVIRKEKSCGVGECANTAIKTASTDYIVKMDSDDIALPERCEKQLRLFAENPGLDMCGSYIEEFNSETGEAIAVKRTPVENDEIRSYAKRRNPFNNQTLVYKKSAAQKVGGYSTERRCEDYDFVVRMLQSGAVGKNIPEVLVKYRVTAENLSRRKNARNTRSFISVRWRIFRSGYSSFTDFLIPCAAQIALFILPSSLTGKLYKKFLRK
ncbi:MAG: glycosyltransferase [Oscillospiraceae bacterium]